MRRTALLCLPALLLVACGGGDSDDAAEASSSSADVTTATTPARTSEAAAVTDEAAQFNCTRSGLDYLPLRTALDGGDDLTFPVQLLTRSDPDYRVPTTPDGEAVTTAILELQLATAVAAVAPNDNADELLEALDTLDAACDEVA